MKALVYLVLIFSLMLTSCVSKKKYLSLQSSLTTADDDLGKCGKQLNEYMNKLAACEQKNLSMKEGVTKGEAMLDARMAELKSQIADLQAQRDQQAKTIEGMTNISQTANDNISETLSQLQTKDKYIHLLQAAKSRTDSINLALAVNLKSVLNDGINDQDIQVKVDKTVVMVNLSDNMLFNSGSYNLSSNARNVLGKIATIIQSRPELDVMVEGYTDNLSIKNSCLKDNWDLSVHRATSVVRVLQDEFDIDPNRLEAAGRGEYNTLTTNDTAEGRAKNRRTRILIMPKLDQFYDLLDPSKAPKN